MMFPDAEKEKAVKSHSRDLRTLARILPELHASTFRSATVLFDMISGRTTYAELLKALHDGVRLGMIQRTQRAAPHTPIPSGVAGEGLYRLRLDRLELPLNQAPDQSDIPRRQ